MNELEKLRKENTGLRKEHARIRLLQEKLQQEVLEKDEVLRIAAAQFSFYMTEHERRGNTDKAKVNRRFADACAKAAAQRTPISTEIKNVNGLTKELAE